MEVQPHQTPGTPTTATSSQADLEQWFGNWIWRAVQCLVESPDFNSSPKWIASRLNISVENAVEAIEGIERLGCIRREGASFKVVDNWMQLTPDKLEANRLLAGQARIVPQLMSKMTPTDAYTSQFFIGNRELIRKYAPKFMELFKQMNDEGMKAAHTDVVAAQISFVQLTSDKAGGAQ